MLKKSRLMSNIICAGMLISTLPVTLHAPPMEQQTPKRGLSKVEIDQKIAEITKVVTGLKYAKITIPTIVLGGGVAAASIVLLIAFLSLIRLGKQIKLLRRYQEGSVTLTDQEKDKIKEWIEKWQENFKKRHQRLFAKTAGLTEEVMRSRLESEKETSIILGIIATPGITIMWGAITSALLWITGITTPLAQKLFGLSTTSVARAFENVRQLKQIENDNPGMLTAQQKRVITQLKKLQKNPIAQGIIKNLRLKDALTKIVNTAIQQHQLLVALIGKKQARKLFATYIKLRWKEKTLQKAADQYDAMKISGLQPFTTKRQLNKTKKKIAILDVQYHLLRTKLERAVQTYSTQADRILEELKGELIKAVEIKKLKPRELPQRTIPL